MTVKEAFEVLGIGFLYFTVGGTLAGLAWVATLTVGRFLVRTLSGVRHSITLFGVAVLLFPGPLAMAVTGIPALAFTAVSVVGAVAMVAALLSIFWPVGVVVALLLGAAPCEALRQLIRQRRSRQERHRGDMQAYSDRPYRS